MSKIPEVREIFEEPAEFLKLKQILLGEGINENEFEFQRQLVRGLDYYTGFIFELKPSGNITDLTIGSGGRYDNLIGIFAGKQIPAVGFSFGLDRLIEVLP
jgi:histidyl-tRNA synthetase